MRIVLLGGFLGSGKTSTLMPLLRYLVEDATPGGVTKAVVIENEIGEVGIDDTLVRAGDYTVRNLFSGCACCTLAGELASGIKEIQDDMHPEWIVIEATGIAYPKRMKDLIEEEFAIEPRVCVVVDAKRWKRLLVPMQSLLPGQLKDADVILINKVDTVSPELLEEVKKSVRLYNTEARSICMSATMPIDDSVWLDVLGMSHR